MIALQIWWVSSSRGNCGKDEPNIYIADKSVKFGRDVRFDQLINPFMPTGAFSICCPRDCVTRHNGGTSGAPLKPLRVDSALKALSTLRCPHYAERRSLSDSKCWLFLWLKKPFTNTQTYLCIYIHSWMWAAIYYLNKFHWKKDDYWGGIFSERLFLLLEISILLLLNKYGGWQKTSMLRQIFLASFRISLNRYLCLRQK